MKTPPRLQSLVDEGLIDTVVRQLMSGKEAMAYVVHCTHDGALQARCAKVYKEAQQRSFRQAVDYTENRKVKNSRQARAMAKGTKFGRQAQEAAWQSAEVDALYRLAAAGVRVPTPYNFHDGVLLMELVTDADGDAAPRLNDCEFSPEDARRHHATLVKEAVRMLCAGEAVERVDLGALPRLLLLLAAEFRALGHGARLARVLDLAVLGVVHGLAEAAVRRLLVGLGTQRLVAAAHHEHHRLLAAHELARDGVDQPFVDEGLQSFRRFHQEIVPARSLPSRGRTASGLAQPDPPLP